jgi:hypothetical protein
LDSGADDEIALRRSNEAFAALELHYHVSSGAYWVPPLPRRRQRMPRHARPMQSGRLHLVI